MLFPILVLQRIMFVRFVIGALFLNAVNGFGNGCRNCGLLVLFTLYFLI